MTDPITKHQQLKKEQERIAKEIEKLENDEKYQKALEFKKDIEDVLEMHGKTKDDLLGLFEEPAAEKTKRTSAHKTAKLPMKRYKNPETNEVVQARSFKNATLKEWADKHGKDIVKSWEVVISDEGTALEGGSE